jgi:uncharacterized protein
MPQQPIQRIYQRLNTTPEKIAAFCEKWQIAEFSLFGSVLRDDFRVEGENPSDIDVLYIHEPEAKYGFEIFDMKEDLENLFNRKVDFISKKAIQNSRNWLRRQTILEAAQVIYAKRSAVTYWLLLTRSNILEPLKSLSRFGRGI